MAADLQAGTILDGTYELVAAIGRGGMGTVWSAQHLRLPRRVAIKVLHKVPDPNSVAYARFRREAEIASRLNHPNIVEVLDFNVHENGEPYFVMPLLNGISLSARMAAGPVTLEEARRWMRQIGSALQAAHAENVIHRDLKPANIFLCRTEVDGRPAELLKILDFGTSKILGSDSVQTAQAIIIGTPQYMAPEQAAADHDLVGPHTDQFALGGLAYEILSGSPAFGTGHPAAIVYRIMHEEPRPLAELIPALDPTVVAAIERAMKKIPAQRFATLQAFVSAFCGDEAIPAELQTIHLGPAENESQPAESDSRSQPHEPLAYQEITAASETQPPSSTEAPARPLWAIAVGIGVLAAAAITLNGMGEGQAEREKPSPPVSQTPPEVVARPDRPSEIALKPGPTPTPPVAPPGAGPETRPAELRVATAEDRRRERQISETPPDGSTKRSKPRRIGPRTRPPKRPEPADREPANKAAAADAAAARAALSSGDHRKALHLARRSIRLQRNAIALTVIVKAHCGTGDLGSARAALHAVPSGRRSGVLRYCKRKGITL